MPNQKAMQTIGEIIGEISKLQSCTCRYWLQTQSGFMHVTLPCTAVQAEQGSAEDEILLRFSTTELEQALCIKGRVRSSKIETDGAYADLSLQIDDACVNIFSRRIVIK